MQKNLITTRSLSPSYISSLPHTHVVSPLTHLPPFFCALLQLPHPLAALLLAFTPTHLPSLPPPNSSNLFHFSHPSSTFLFYLFPCIKNLVQWNY